ncbi:TPA: DUF2829 domain-containing protein [Salmonella enterica subsp. enterica serovar Lehrte]|nr:DUF2829 domain-containing protein [Salmonella enterica subsp. enterica serovar Agbeni]HCM2492607.1 DUF2829 domain-containing protein [Salmonella enterica subsp. enterica serovar Lehrte]
MKGYIGVKMVNAKEMNRKDYNDFRGWQLPENEEGTDEGFLVEYLDGGKPNTQAYSGYVSWSPKDVFDKAYRRASAMSFGLALEAMKEGFQVARHGWNGKGMWLKLVNPPQSAIPADWHYEVTCGDEYTLEPSLKLLPWIGMKTADGGFVPWLASQTDMLADDWIVLPEYPVEGVV